jgi:TonB-linked SusC/RagA family outer membrane protein
MFLKPYLGPPLPEKKRTFFHQMFLIMRLVLLFTILCCLQATAKVFAQRINISVKNAPIETVLDEIKKQSGYSLITKDHLLDNVPNLSITLKNASIQKALDECFKNLPLAYELVGKTIVVKEKPENNNKAKSQSQFNGPIKGIVKDSTGRALVGATVLIKETALKTVTDATGRFSFNNVPDNAILIITYVGYEKKEISAVNDLTIYLAKSYSKLDEVQVIAYGTTTRRLSTGDISTVKAADIESQPVSNPLAALQGRVPGLVITQTSGVAGSAFKVQLRGQSSLDLTLSQNNPLFVIDGVPFETGNAPISQVTSAANNPVSTSSGGLSALNSINPQDIESIDVLKDADATSIYGSRGANGVILITTKKGKPGKTTVSLNLNSGISRVGRTMDMLNTQQYVQIRKEAYRNDGLTPSANSSDPGYAPDIMLWDTTRYTDLKKLLIGNTAHYNNFQGSISGGNNLTEFRIGGNYHRETSVYAKDYSDQVGSGSFSLSNHSADGKFNLQFSSIYSNDNNHLPEFDLTQFINLPPNLLLYNNQGGLAWDENGVTFSSLGLTNPLSYLNRTYEATSENLSSNLNLSYKLLPVLSIKVNLGYNTFNLKEHSTESSLSIDPSFAGSTFPAAYFANTMNKNWIAEPQLMFEQHFPFGKINALIGSTFQSKSSNSDSQYGSNYQSDLLLNSIQAAGSISAQNNAAIYRYTAFFGRLNYNFQNKYIVDLTGRRDGSSRFGPNRQWATFGAIGAAWNFTEEKFLKDKLPLLSFGKLRGSYGTTGNDQIGDYKYLNLWTNNPYSYNGTPSLSPSSLYNPAYNWEVNKKLEVALELGLLKDRILFNATYYRNRSSNQLIKYILPNQTGFTSVIRNFPGLVQNSGWEFSVNSKNIVSKVFSWSTAFNISLPRNVLISFPNLASSSYSSKYIVGQSLNLIRGFKYLGVDPATGVYTFQDVNKDGQLTSPQDYQTFGNLDPKFTGGLQNNFTYKNFDLSFFFQFTMQTGLNYLYQLAGAIPGNDFNQPTLVLNRWQNPGDQTNIQKLTTSFIGATASGYGNIVNSNGTYSDASYIKLKNLSFSYRLPAKWTRDAGITSCRLYLQGENLLTLTRYKGADPETQNFSALPPLRTFVAGIQLNL